MLFAPVGQVKQGDTEEEALVLMAAPGSIGQDEYTHVKPRCKPTSLGPTTHTLSVFKCIHIAPLSQKEHPGKAKPQKAYWHPRIAFSVGRFKKINSSSPNQERTCTYRSAILNGVN